MSIVPRRLFDGLRSRVGLSRDRIDGPRLVVGVGDGFGEDNPVRDQVMQLLRDRFAIATTIDSSDRSGQAERIDIVDANRRGVSKSDPVWRGTKLLEDGVGNLFVALQASAGADEVIVHVRPALDYNQSKPFPFERCASFEVTSATISSYEESFETLVLALSPTAGQLSDNAEAGLVQRISRISNDLNIRIKTTLAQSDVGEQRAIWQAYATCLHWLGAHDNRTDLLVEATRYYHVSLDSQSRRTTPLLWASVQNSLGVALCNIDRLVPSLHRLRLAIEAFHSGLEAISNRQAPPLKSALYVNLGHANLKLYQSSRDREHIELAIDAFENALQYQPKDQAPSRWASIFDGLGTALREHGSATQTPNELIQAIQAYHSAMEIRGLNETSTASTITSVNLGRALCRLGALQSSNYRLLEGIEILQRTLPEIDREQQLNLWVEAQEAIGSALLVVGRRERTPDYLCGAVAALNESLGGLDAINQLADWGLTKVKIGRAYHLLGKLLGANERAADREVAARCLEQAEQACLQAGAAYETLGADEPAAQMNLQIDKIRRTYAWINESGQVAVG